MSLPNFGNWCCAEGVDGRLHNTTTADNIAAIIPGHLDDEPTHHRQEDCFVNEIVLNPIRNTHKPLQISAKHRYTDSLHFVLLFPKGELGWRLSWYAGDSLHSCVFVLHCMYVASIHNWLAWCMFLHFPSVFVFNLGCMLTCLWSVSGGST